MRTRRGAEAWGKGRRSSEEAHLLTCIVLFQADKLQTLIKAAGVEDVEPIWTQLFAKVRPDTSRLEENVPRRDFETTRCSPAR